MNKISYFLMILTILALSSSIVVGVSAPREFAIHTEEKQCAGFWEGDEYRSYHLPKDWVSYPQELIGVQNNANSYTIVKTPLGDCNLSQINEQQCCSKFEYTYISPNIGKKAFYLQVLGDGFL